jgi:hypothetical protein
MLQNGIMLASIIVAQKLHAEKIIEEISEVLQ